MDVLCQGLRAHVRVCETSGLGTKRMGARAVSLRDLGDHLGLSPTTVSLVLNGSPSAASIPKETQDRVFAAAKKFNYRPNFLARSLRSQRTYLIGVMVPELGEGYSSLVLSGIEQCLLAEGYVYLVTSHRHKPDLLERGPRLFYERCVEGLIAVDTPIRDRVPIPVVSISGHDRVPGVTNIVLDHDRAAHLGLSRLAELGHRRIAFFQGQTFSSDTDVRWNAIVAAAARLGLEIDPRLVVRLEGDSPSPQTGYCAARKLLGSRAHFTALWAFNDISAIGAVRALIEAGRAVPQDVSVMGFDDVYAAAFYNPALTTVRQPLARMGALAAATLLRRIAEPDAACAAEESVEPELIERESTGPAPR
jgi:DNA-binding LacI/PurR family transcriptional regulator